jgi:hypothetical protein
MFYLHHHKISDIAYRIALAQFFLLLLPGREAA